MVMFLSTSFKVLSLVTSSILRPGFGRGSERIGIFMVRVSRIRGYTASLYKIPESMIGAKLLVYGFYMCGWLPISAISARFTLGEPGSNSDAAMPKSKAASCV